MSALLPEWSCESATLGAENRCNKRASAVSAKDMMVAECNQQPGMFAVLCQKLLCRRGHHGDEDTTDVCRVQDGGLSSLCCGRLYPRQSECHRTVTSNSRQMSVHWVPSLSSMEATTCQPGSISRCHPPKCSCGNDFSTADSCEAGISRACMRNDSVPGGTLRRSDARVSDSLQRGSKQSGTMRRVMLADAAYGHAMVLDDCMLSDSDAWSGSLSLSRPNSGTNSLERGTSAVQENANANEVYESNSDEGEAEDEVLWPAVMPLPALPVYDQVRY